MGSVRERSQKVIPLLIYWERASLIRIFIFHIWYSQCCKVSLCGLQGLWSHADTQADLNLCLTHVLEGTFSDIGSHLMATSTKPILPPKQNKETVPHWNGQQLNCWWVWRGGVRGCLPPFLMNSQLQLSVLIQTRTTVRSIYSAPLLVPEDITQSQFTWLLFFIKLPPETLLQKCSLQPCTSPQTYLLRFGHIWIKSKRTDWPPLQTGLSETGNFTCHWESTARKERIPTFL